MTKISMTDSRLLSVKLGIAFSMLSACTYGLNPIFAKLGYSAGLSGVEILHARFIFAVLLLGAVGPLLQEKFYSFSATLIKKSLFIGFLVLLPLNLLYVYALKDIPASMMSLITYVYPLIILVINGVVFHKQISKSQITSICLILLACVCIFSDAFRTHITAVALCLGFLSTFMYAFYLLSLQQLATHESVYQLTFLTLLFPTLGLCCFHNPLSVLSFDAVQLSVTAGYGIISTVLSTIFVSKAVQFLGATQAGIFCSFEPVFTIGFASILLGEQIPVFRWIGMIFLILGIVIPNRLELVNVFKATSLSIGEK